MKIELACLNKINYGLASNGSKIISSISIFNDEDRNFSNLEVKVRCEPDFFSPFIFGVSFIEKGTRVIEENIDVVLNFSYLFDINESKKGNIIIEIFEKDECIANLNSPIELLSFDEWDGISYGPESIANFVLPNDKTVELLKRQALNFLSKENPNYDFVGYTSEDKEFVLKQICSIFLSIQEQGIRYSMPKASFEVNGQKVRLPAEILSSKFATCLDSTLLFASIAESIGLNPLVILTDTHAFLGVWLTKYHYESTSINDASFLINKFNSKDVVFIETTLLTKAIPVSFSDALNSGYKSLTKYTKTFSAVDIESCRNSGIKPLPLSVNNENKYILNKDVKDNINVSYDIEDLEYINGQFNKDRFDVWEKKLLDLNGRNKLINFNPNYNNQLIQLFCTDIYQLFDELFKNNLQLLSKNEFINSTLNDKIYEFLDGSAVDLFINDLKSGRIRLMVNQKNLLNVCKNILQASKSSIEENGTNTLFLSFGTLKYKEKGKERYAPLVLMPLEISKGMTGQSYYISIRDDEIFPNQTLFEYVKANFDINFDNLLKIPYNENTHTYELKPYLNTLRMRITGISGFSLSESCFIGQFSFTRFIMWNDLRLHKSELLKSKIIKSLVDPSIRFQNEALEVSSFDLDNYSPDKFAIPLSADSSQTEAIINAANGLSFVLNGPPGTGKSQTITNMIINSLYNHKKVLFVAQKMAALEVVKKRLDDTGLGLFCIELHSNKAQKTEVLSKINNILELGKLKKPLEYQQAADDLLIKRKSLNSIISHLHRPLETGFYLAENILEYEEVKNDVDISNIEKIDYSKVTKTLYEETLDQINKYINAKKEIGQSNIDYFSYLKFDDYSIEYRNSFTQNLIEFKNIIDELIDEATNLNTKTSALSNLSNRYFVNNFVDTYNFYVENQNELYKELFLNGDDSYFEHLKMIISKIHDLNPTHMLIKSSFDPQIVNFNLEHLNFKLQRAKNLNFIKRSIEINKVIRELKSYSINPKILNKKNVERILLNLIEYINFNSMLANEENTLKKYLGDDFSSFTTNIDEVTKKIKLTSKFKNSLTEFKINGVGNIFNFLEDFITLNSHTFIENISKYLQKANYFKEKYEFNFEKITPNNYINEVIEVVQNLISNSQKLKDYILYSDELNKLKSLNIGDLVVRNLNGKIKDDELVKIYKKTIHYNLALKAISEDEKLNLFSGRKENEIINEYKKQIEEYNILTIKEVAYRLSKSTSEFFDDKGSLDESKQFMYLKKAISNNGRGISLRTLFDNIKDIIFDICPCFLMSPLSVAQYFDLKNPAFDIVIFDEASQITTSDAVGALARGESAIIVGDEKQLPPTRFFEAGNNEEDDLFIEDGDSILTDALSISMPKKYLTWHYRSKDESLIAFSNSQYYENKLLTFPSPYSMNSSISFNYCNDAIYENRKNVKEAQYIVKELERRLQDPELSRKSIGIVTFSISQQKVIMDEIQKLYKKHPELEFVENDRHEELFIKNLENVQGDERDIIIFSICYGPDKYGHVSMNFGPLSNKGGEKRLNVAVSRAREEMLIFSSMLPDMIDLNRVTGLGSKNLKEFLQYAINGKSYILIRNGEQVKYKEGIEKFIAADLRNRGFNVDIDVGTSEFRVDLAIVNPQDPNKYALGILLDSESYINSKTSKDRNVVQASVLKRLGWKIFRVWTLDYFDSPDLVIDKIIDAMNKEDQEEVKDKPNIIFEKADENNRKSNATNYQSYLYPKILDSDSFYEYLDETKKVIDFYIKHEEPISYRLLMKKVLETYSITRAGQKIKDIFESLLPKYQNMTGENRFIWFNPGFHVEKYRVGSKDRDFIDIPKEEICLAIKDIISNKLCCSREELIRYIITTFGFSKVTDSSKVIINISIDLAIALKYVREEEGIIYLFSK